MMLEDFNEMLNDFIEKHQLDSDPHNFATMPPVKGELNGLCNRKACLKPGAIYYNHSTKKHYCPSCADMLNDYNRPGAMDLYGHDLCTRASKGD